MQRLAGDDAYSKDDAGVLVCGPSEMAAPLAPLCQAFSERNNGQRRFHFHSETS